MDETFNLQISQLWKWCSHESVRPYLKRTSTASALPIWAAMASAVIPVWKWNITGIEMKSISGYGSVIAGISLAPAKIVRTDAKCLLCQNASVRITFSYSILHDMTNSIFEILKVGVQLVMLDLFVWQYVQKTTKKTAAHVTFPPNRGWTSEF